jgi:hypothetical protein
MGYTPAAAAETKAAPPRSYFLLGALLCLAGPVIYFAQFSWLKHFTTPWYAPLLGTAGVLMMAVAFWQNRRFWRVAILGLFVLLCGFEWFLILSSRLPAYSGPAQPGKKIPAFSAVFADGRAFTDKELEDGKPVVLLFNRGHW